MGGRSGTEEQHGFRPENDRYEAPGGAARDRRCPADKPKLVIETGMSRYQRKSANLRDRVAAAAIEVADEDVTIDLTAD